MKKKYLKIETMRTSEIKSRSLFLLTDNVTGFITENNETRLYFKSANPFSYARLYIPGDNFERLMLKQIFTYSSIVETTTFFYSIIEL